MVNRLQQPSLLRIHAFRFSGRDGEELGIKCRNVVFDKVSLSNIKLWISQRERLHA